MTLILLAPVLLAASEPALGQQLTPGHPRVISAGFHTHSHYFIDVPNHTQRLVITLSGGWGNGNLHAKRNPPAIGVWTHHSTHPTNNDRIEIHHPQAGRWWVLVYGAGAYHHATLMGDYVVQNNGGLMHTASTFGPILGEMLGRFGNRPDRDDDEDNNDRDDDPPEIKLVPLKSGVVLKGLGSEEDRIDYYRLETPANVTRLSFEASGGKGECVLLIRRDGLPTLEANDFCSAEPGTCQVITIENPRSGVYYARLVGATRFKGVSLLAEYRKAPVVTGDMGSGQRIFIMRPAEATVATARKTIDVVWLAPDHVRTVRIEVSADGGKTWSLVAALPAETPRFLWFVSRDIVKNAASLLLRISDQANPDNATTRELMVTKS